LLSGAYPRSKQATRPVTPDIIPAMGNLELVRKDDVSSFRKIAIGTWQNAYDPSVYGTMTIHMDEAVKYIEKFREKTGRRLTVSHMMAKVAAEALKTMPDANAILRWNRVYLRKRIGVFFQVVMTDEGEGKVDLSGATLYDVENMSLLSICDEFEKKVSLVRERKDPALEKTRGMFHKIPYFFLNRFMKILSFLMYTLNLKLPGTPSDPFGSIMITNIGSLGLDVAYVPLVPYSRVPILLAVGAVKDEPVVRDNQVVPGKIMRINATFDHRFIDGFHAAQMSKIVRRWLEDPFKHFDPLT
jgi:pyruvate dehydrogenase E2 component (dihydrolipoamide acetyltransferase)